LRAARSSSHMALSIFRHACGLASKASSPSVRPGPRKVSGVWRTVFVISTAVSLTASAQPAANVKDLQNHFAACFEPPLSLNGSRLTFYFSLASNGRMIGGQPRTVWFGLHASESDRQRLFEKASNSLLANCFPVSLNREMARLIPGDVFYLQFAETERGISALLRPYGSHVSPDDLLYRRYRW
jgi:hypothetical protein